MNRLEFMKKLRALLMDVEESEREEALDFYEHYFDDAGAENEQEVITSLGSPEKVARMIKDGLNDGAKTQGEFTENGYSGYGETTKDEIGYPATTDSSKKRRATGGLILLLIAAVFALPILGPIVIGIGSALFGVLAVAAALLFALVIVGIAILVVGAGAFAAAIGCLFVTPAISVLLFGVSLLLLGIGILATILGIWVVTKVIPVAIRFIVDNVRKLLKKKEE